MTRIAQKSAVDAPPPPAAPLPAAPALPGGAGGAVGLGRPAPCFTGAGVDPWFSDFREVESANAIGLSAYGRSERPPIAGADQRAIGVGIGRALVDTGRALAGAKSVARAGNGVLTGCGVCGAGTPATGASALGAGCATGAAAESATVAIGTAWGAANGA